MAKQKRKTLDEIQKEKYWKNIQHKMQAECDKKKHVYMGEFMRAWNAKNTDKIQECVKMGHTINFKFSGGITIACHSDYMCLG